MGSVLFTKILPAPFAFQGSSGVGPGSYGQGTYGYAWLHSTTNKVFVSDPTNQTLWSGDQSNANMVIETTFPYPETTIPVHVGASIQSNSSLTGSLSFGAGINASLTTDSTFTGTQLNDHSTANITAGSFLTGAYLASVTRGYMLADSFLTASLEFETSDNMWTANSNVTAELTQTYLPLNLAVTGPFAIIADSLVTADISIRYLIHAAIEADSVANIRADLYLIGVPVSPTKLRVLFPELMNDSDVTVATTYTVMDMFGNGIPVLSVTADDPPYPIAVSLILGTSLTTTEFYSVSVPGTLTSFYGNQIGAIQRNSDGTFGTTLKDAFQWIAPDNTVPINIPLSTFTGEVQGGLYGNPDGLVFFSPALNVPAANSVIQVEEVDVCTYAYDTYTPPVAIDPIPLFTFGMGRPAGSVLGPGGAVLWAPFPRNMEAKFELGFSPTLTNDIVPSPSDSSVVVVMQTTWALGYVALLNDTAYVTYAEQFPVPATPPLFITANNIAPIPGGGTLIWFGLSTPVAAVLTGAATVSAKLSETLTLSKAIVADSNVAAGAT
jgi:hypothetical protein